MFLKKWRFLPFPLSVCEARKVEVFVTTQRLARHFSPRHSPVNFECGCIKIRTKRAHDFHTPPLCLTEAPTGLSHHQIWRCHFTSVMTSLRISHGHHSRGVKMFIFVFTLPNVLRVKLCIQSLRLSFVYISFSWPQFQTFAPNTFQHFSENAQLTSFSFASRMWLQESRSVSAWKNSSLDLQIITYFLTI